MSGDSKQEGSTRPDDGNNGDSRPGDGRPTLTPADLLALFAKWRSRFGERRLSDITELIREDRER